MYSTVVRNFPQERNKIRCHLHYCHYIQCMSAYPYNSQNGQTELMAAAYHGDSDEVIRLLESPADVDAQDQYGTTALMYAAMKGQDEVVRELVEHKANLDLQSSQRYTALMYAVRDGHTKSVQILLQAGADPNVHGDYDTYEIPLTLAARAGYFPIVRALVAAGANTSLHGGYSQLTAECVARLEGHHDISEFLLYHEKRPTKKKS
jgi:ankyrin repeat protein